MLQYNKYIKNDNYSTPLCYLKIINPFIPDGYIINDPFYFNGLVKDKWSQLGRNIVHEDKNFFDISKNNKKEIYVTNPSYSNFKEVLKHFFYLDKPFILLIPINKIAQIKIQKILKNKDNLQLIISPIYTGFINDKNEKTRCPSQYFGYLCYKIYLKKDLLFI